MKQIGYGRMHGIALTANSPTRNDDSEKFHGFEVQKFAPPWKIISDLAAAADSEKFHHDSEKFHHMHSPAYSEIVNQV